MPIRIPDTLPAHRILESENVFVMTEQRASVQDIRPLRILILNLMPNKIETETQILRLLSNSPLQVEIELLQTRSHQSKNTPRLHLLDFYKVFDEVKDKRYDGLIITGAPVETLPFEEVDYWEELCEIIDWAKTNVYSTLHICWGAQAGLYHCYGIGKHMLPKKLSGVFMHKVNDPYHPLMRGFGDLFPMPHSRNTGIDKEDIMAQKELVVLAESKEGGPAIIASKNGRRFFVTGHAEYDRHTLSSEYYRDKAKGMNPELPENYFPDDDVNSLPFITWRAHAHLLYANWLNYYVYQQTPYDLSELMGI